MCRKLRLNSVFDRFCLIAILILFLIFSISKSAAAVCTIVDGSLVSVSNYAVQKFSYALKDCNYVSYGNDFRHGKLNSNDSKLRRAGDKNDKKPKADKSVNYFQLEQRNSVIPNLKMKQRLSRVVSNIGDRAQELAREMHMVAWQYNIDPILLHAIAHIESRHNPNAISPVGARGLMQIMPNTARRFGVDQPERDLHEPLLNLYVSCAYLKLLQKKFGNNLSLVLAAYNAGEGAVLKYGGTVPPYSETINYVQAVTDYYLKLKKI